MPTDAVKIIPIPVCDHNDPASLEAFFGPFGYADYFRKVVLSNCAEIIRAEAKEKLTEARLSDLAHTHDLYVDFLIQSLNGRRLREQNVRDSITQGANRA